MANNQAPNADEEDRQYQADEQIHNCGHIAIVSISDTETQCMDCLRKWPKKKDFKSDYPVFDRG